MNKSERRKASQHEDGVNFISNLPDPILLLILTGLPSTQEVIRTSILSRRWRYVWTSIPALDLQPSQAMEKSKFKEFVDWVLSNRSVDLDSFRLCCADSYSISTVERWIHTTVMRNVKKIDLAFWPSEKSEDMVLPHCLVTCASLEELSLFMNRTRLIFPRFSGFPALRVLKLWNVELLANVVLKSFLESCPLLEDLALEDCMLNKLDLLYISCPKLKKLRIYKWEKAHSCGCVLISCPQLVFLDLYGQITSQFISEPMYSLKEVVIDPHGNTTHGLFPGISHVESLKIDLHFLYKCMDDARDLALPNLKNLELTSRSAFFTADELNKILKNCPELKSLSLTFENDIFRGKYLDLDEAETMRIFNPDVKWVESFEFNGEKPKVDIQWYKNESMHMDARWGNEAR